MTALESTEGDRIRALLESGASNVGIVAPFIKTHALRSLLGVVADSSHVRCVTRWRAREVAAGVSDPEILELLEARGNFTLSVVDELHAKLYWAGERCLAGSANVTNAGLGDSVGGGNIEVLVETTIVDPAIAATLARIGEVERLATESMARAVRRLADVLVTSDRVVPGGDVPWFPLSRRPKQAYRFYSEPPSGFLRAADGLLLDDLARADLPAGLGEEEFKEAIRRLLGAMPLGAAVLSGRADALVTRRDMGTGLEELAAGAEGSFSAEDVWRSFVEWMAQLFPERLMKQEVADIALRRAQRLDR